MKKPNKPIKPSHRAVIKQGLARRYRAEKRFRLWGLAAVVFAFCFLSFLLVSLTVRALPSFYQVEITLPLRYDVAVLDKQKKLEGEMVILQGDMAGVLAQGLYTALQGGNVGDVANNLTNNSDQQQKSKGAAQNLTTTVPAAWRDSLLSLLSPDAVFETSRYLYQQQTMLNKMEERSVLASSLVDNYIKGHGANNLTLEQKNWLQILAHKKLIHKKFNWRFFTNGDSQRPESAGILNGVLGSLLTIAICFAVSFPIAIMAGIYLEEFFDAKHARPFWQRFFNVVEVNINSLAAVPSIIYGLLGLSVLVNFFGVPRSSSLAGGLTLGLMTMPLLIIVTRSALRAVPNNIREAALSLGINRWQLVLHHLLPLSLSGILTGTILGLSRAVGETAPLILIGMVAFVMSAATDVTSPTTTLPVQVFLWANHADTGFIYKTAAAIIVLLFLIFLINLTVIIIRQKWTKQSRV